MIRRVVTGLGLLALGALGFLLMEGAQHLYLDHQRVDQIWDLELRRAAAAQASTPPPPGVVK